MGICAKLARRALISAVLVTTNYIIQSSSPYGVDPSMMID